MARSWCRRYVWALIYAASSSLSQVWQISYASNLLYVLPLTLSKAAMTVLLLRLTPVKSHRRYLKGLLCVIVIWGAVFVVAIASSCDTAHSRIRFGGKCSAYVRMIAVRASKTMRHVTDACINQQRLRWELFEALGCLFEGGVLLLAVWLVWDLQTGIGDKAVVVEAFSFRLG
jgi:hypothetical protein